LTTRCSTGIYLSLLNQHLLTAVENSGDAFLSNALIGGKFVLRACIVNFHTSLRDIEALPLLLSRLGEEADTTLRPERVKLGDGSRPMGHGNGRDDRAHSGSTAQKAEPTRSFAT